MPKLGKVNGGWNRSTSLTLVATGRRGAHDLSTLLEDGRMGMHHMIRLRGGTLNVEASLLRGHCESSLLKRLVTVAEGFERNELRELSAEYLWVTSKTMRQDLGRLLSFGEVTALEEASRTRVHGKQRWARELDR